MGLGKEPLKDARTFFITYNLSADEADLPELLFKSYFKIRLLF